MQLLRTNQLWQALPAAASDAIACLQSISLQADELEAEIRAVILQMGGTSSSKGVSQHCSCWVAAQLPYTNIYIRVYIGTSVPALACCEYMVLTDELEAEISAIIHQMGGSSNGGKGVSGGPLLAVNSLIDTSTLVVM